MKTGLVIEDNSDNMVLITRLLEKAGYRTLQAETGRAGVDMAVWQQPDFIILDIQLPDIDGIEVLQQLRDSEAGKNIPVIAMTSYAMTGDREKIMMAGCTGYIEKPIDPARVIDQIRKILEESTENTGGWR
ncbi:MAG: response regulator [Deltaproteobacteria bacterium]|nr:response regulator [Deltaproteobacteria bacterium]